MSFKKAVKMEKYKFTTYLRFLWYFILRNLKRLSSGNVDYKERFIVNQYLFFTGKGLLKLEKNVFLVLKWETSVVEAV